LTGYRKPDFPRVPTARTSGRLVSRSDDDVLGPRRAVEEVPGLKRTLLALDDQQALALQDEEGFFPLFGVVHRHRLAGQEPVEVDAELREVRFAPALEGAVAAELVVDPACVACVDDEPAVRLWNAALELRLVDHRQRQYPRVVEPLARLTALGFSTEDAQTLAEHFLDAEKRGKRGHGLARVEWLETLEGLDPSAEPECVVAEACYERWEGRGAPRLPDAGGDLRRPAGGSARGRAV